MKLNLHFRHIYSNQSDDGLHPSAFIVYAKRIHKYRRRGSHMKTGYRHAIIVDLWLFAIRFTWVERGIK